MKELQQEMKEKINTSETLVYMQELCTILEIFPYSTMNIKKQKRDLKIFNLCYDLYKFHSPLHTIVKQFETSVLLIQNEIAVPYLLAELSAFNKEYENLKKKVSKHKQYQEITKYYKIINYDQKWSRELLLRDLEKYSKMYNFNFKINESVTKSKSIVVKH